MNDLIDEHRGYVSDARRIEAFRRALAVSVRPGDRVLDLGAGTGILGLLACQAGAGRVYAVDDGPILVLAREIARGTAYAERIVHLRGHSSWVDVPERVDVIVTDQVGHFGFEAGIAVDLPEARARWLEEGGRLIPQRLRLGITPAALPAVRAEVEFWTVPVAGIPMPAASRVAGSTGHPHRVLKDALLGGGTPVCDLDLHTPVRSALKGDAAIDIERPGTFDAWVGWFSAELAPGVLMTNDPASSDAILRRPLVLPVMPIDVLAGEQAEVSLSMHPRSGLLTWTTRLRDRFGAVRHTERRSSVDSLLASAADVSRLSPAATPTLTRVGLARALVLARCDGAHTVAEIEQAVAAGFPDVFADAEAASAFVAEVLSANGR